MDAISIQQRITGLVPGWLAWPLSVLSTLAALGATVLVFFAAMDGEYSPAIWAGVTFVGSAVLWYVSDIAAGNRQV